MKKIKHNESHSVSIVIPFYNEEGNVLPCTKKIQSVMENYALLWELILVNDGSRDRTNEELQQARKQLGSHVYLVELQRNFGQTSAMQAGIDAARGSIIVTLDGDLQNDPADIPGMVKDLIDWDMDLLVGWRKDRKDKLLLRKLPSLIANKLISKVTGVKLNDYGCSLKAYQAKVLKDVRLYGEMHRFIPAWVAAVVPVHRISERVVSHHPRSIGTSKYGISRTFRVLIDLLFVWFFMRFQARPGHFFGSIGLFFITLGSLTLSWLMIDKFLLGHDIGGRPLLLMSIVSIIAALQFFTTGILAEILSRVYFETGQKSAYIKKDSNIIDRSWSR